MKDKRTHPVIQVFICKFDLSQVNRPIKRFEHIKKLQSSPVFVAMKSEGHHVIVVTKKSRKDKKENDIVRRH